MRLKAKVGIRKTIECFGDKLTTYVELEDTYTVSSERKSIVCELYKRTLSLINNELSEITRNENAKRQQQQQQQQRLRLG